MIGTSNKNPIFNTEVYNVQTNNGHKAEYTENVIAENLYRQVDGDGYNYIMLYEIFGHKKTYDAIPTDSGYYETRNGVKRRAITTKVWQLKVGWDSGKPSHIALKDIKETNPVEIEKDENANKIDKEAAFAWWVM